MVCACTVHLLGIRENKVSEMLVNFIDLHCTSTLCASFTRIVACSDRMANSVGPDQTDSGPRFRVNIIMAGIDPIGRKIQLLLYSGCLFALGVSEQMLRTQYIGIFNTLILENIEILEIVKLFVTYNSELGIRRLLSM